MRRKIKAITKTLVLREKRKNPYIGVRGLAVLLKDKYHAVLSKSSVHNALKLKGVKEKKGRKHYFLLYKKQAVEDCTPFILRAFDSSLEFFTYVAACLEKYSPGLSAETVKNFVTLASFSSLSRISVPEAVNKRGFLRACGLSGVPLKKIGLFLKGLESVKPSVNLGLFKESLKPVTTIKFYFETGAVAYCDASMVTIWDGVCACEYFFSTLAQARQRARDIINNKAVFIGYTKSFGYASAGFLNFINGIGRGLVKIELLGEGGRIIEEEIFAPFKPAFFIGYYPKIFTKGLAFLGKQERFKKIILPRGDFFYSSILTRFFGSKDNKGAILNNMLIAARKKAVPLWGVISDKKADGGGLLKKYFFSRPWGEKDFFYGLEAIEKSFYAPAAHGRDNDCFGDSFIIGKEAGLAVLAQMLLEAFKAKVGDITAGPREGYIVSEGDFYKLVCKSISPKVKDNFNKEGFLLEGRKVIIV